MDYWNKLFIAKTPLKARDIIFNMKPDALYQKAIFRYMQKGEYPDYKQKYWQQLSLMFFKSLATAIKTDASDFINKLINDDKFPIVN